MKIVVVTFASPSNALFYQQSAEFNFPLLIDEDRKLYQAYGLEKGSWYQLFGLPSLKVYLHLWLKGRKVNRPTEDIYQLGGNVLIQPDNIIKLHYIGINSVDRPTVDQLLNEVANSHS